LMRSWMGMMSMEHPCEYGCHYNLIRRTNQFRHPQAPDGIE